MSPPPTCSMSWSNTLAETTHPKALELGPLLTANVERRLAAVRFPIRTWLDGRLTGVHSSPQPGVSVEFAEHKEYAPGDDLRHLNWKALARSDKYYIRQFTRETHAEAYLVMDDSASMEFSSAHAPESKLLFGIRLASAIAWVLLHQNDAVGLVGSRLTKRGLELVPARSHPSHYLVLQETLSALHTKTHLRTHSQDAGHSLSHAFEYLVARKLRRSAVFVLSDLFVPQEHVFPYLAHLRQAGNYCCLIHLLDPAEWDMRTGAELRTFPFDGTMVFKSPETGHGLLLDARASRSAYLQRFGAWMSEVQDRCAEQAIEYSACNTDCDIVEFILKYLQERR